MKRLLIIFFATLMLLVTAFFTISAILEFRPEEEMSVMEYFDDEGGTAADTLSQTIRIMSWNIGYAGLGDNMDFFIDGGAQVRDNEERTSKNLGAIIEELKSQEADIYLLQEVDRDSHRTYGIDEIAEIAKAFPDHLIYYAPNFKVWFVPVPMKEPIGRVDSGLLIMTKFQPTAVRRVQYPSAFPFPVSMFNIKRCLLEADFTAADGRILHIANTHCTAFDTGGMRTEENIFLKKRLSCYASAGDSFIVGGDWNQYPPQYSPTAEEIENEFFVPELFDTTGMNSYASVVCDVDRRSMRYNDSPYSDDSTKSILDFFVASNEGVHPSGMQIIDLDFHSSDHNPICMQVDLLP